MAHLLGAEALHLEYPTRVIFDSVTVGLSEGDRVGIVGRNGDGKSTLLRLLSGRLEPDAGRVTRRGGIRLGMLDQADELHSDRTVHEVVIGDIDEHVWAGDPKVRDVISGLIADIPWEARVDDLSGGQRRRVALAALLIGDWDVIFLDEPTNHLDVEGIAWLAKHLRDRWPRGSGALVTVTHDRWFLDEICTATWEVHDRLIEPFEGGYAAYVLQRVERDRMAAASESKRQNLMRKELAWLRRGAPARTAKPKFRIDAANELIENEPPIRDSVSLASMAMQRLGKDVVDLENVSVSYPLPEEGERRTSSTGASAPSYPLPEEGEARLEGSHEVLRNVTWHIAPGERTGILGVNGAGKSTLLNLVAGTLQPTSGKVKRGKTIKVAVLTQQLSELTEVWNDRVNDVISRQKSSYLAGGKILTPGQLLERVGFASAQLSTPVKDLSGGQKRRLQLLLILLSEPNVLILDEPTNDLDTDMLAAIEDLLDSFPGTLLVVSHDRYLIERVTDQQYAVMDGGFRHLPRGVDQYLELRAAPPAPTAVSAVGGGRTEKGELKPSLGGAELRNAQKELAAAGRKLEKLAGQIAQVHARMAEHDPGDYAGLSSLSEELSAFQLETTRVETRWLELSELLGD
ncbi:MAG TPA: ABC-F family ATP-binding cassette domain-containing protein [Terrimesophilobacter sp.]|uniref:ABC-F family ATP-binding cassette domain-containing protein n=1 Tax=Terrimesophilobacter sp. TaxID=2906435 RepID=UPI002F940D06